MSSNWCSEAVDIILSNVDKICWPQLCRNKNPRVIYFLEGHTDRIDWYILSGNPCREAVDLVAKYLHKLDSWYLISVNPFAMDLLENNFDRIIWKGLSSNPHTRAIELLSLHPEKIDYDSLCCNTHPTAIEWLEKNIDKINWFHLSSNPSAIGLLSTHKDKVDHSSLLFNEALCSIV